MPFTSSDSFKQFKIGGAVGETLLEMSEVRAAEKIEVETDHIIRSLLESREDWHIFPVLQTDLLFRVSFWQFNDGDLRKTRRTKSGDNGQKARLPPLWPISIFELTLK